MVAEIYDRDWLHKHKMEQAIQKLMLDLIAVPYDPAELCEIITEEPDDG